MIEMAKCRCGAWLAITTDRNGGTIERCSQRCGYQSQLRGRLPVDHVEAVAAIEVQARTSRPCAWPAGCDGFAAMHNTDLCHTHCTERRTRLNREYARAKSDLLKLRRQLEGAA